MSFGMFFSLFEASKPFDVKAYKRSVKAGQALASKIGWQIGNQVKEPIPDDVRQAIMQEQLIAAIDDPVGVLEHLARYLAMNGDFWAAGKLHATHVAEKKRKKRERSGRRKGARSANIKRKSDRAHWVEAMIRAGARILSTRDGARLSDSALAKRIVASREFSSLTTRRPAWNTVRAELGALKLSRSARAKKRGH
jgi:hypothetical protein